MGDGLVFHESAASRRGVVEEPGRAVEVGAEFRLESGEAVDGDRLAEQRLAQLPVRRVGLQPDPAATVQPELQRAGASPVQLNAAAAPAVTVAPELYVGVAGGPVARAEMVHEP